MRVRKTTRVSAWRWLQPLVQNFVKQQRQGGDSKLGIWAFSHREIASTRCLEETQGYNACLRHTIPVFSSHPNLQLRSRATTQLPTPSPGCSTINRSERLKHRGSALPNTSIDTSESQIKVWGSPQTPYWPQLQCPLDNTPQTEQSYGTLDHKLTKNVWNSILGQMALFDMIGILRCFKREERHGNSNHSVDLHCKKSSASQEWKSFKQNRPPKPKLGLHNGSQTSQYRWIVQCAQQMCCKNKHRGRRIHRQRERETEREGSAKNTVAIRWRYADEILLVLQRWCLLSSRPILPNYLWGPSLLP